MSGLSRNELVAIYNMSKGIYTRSQDIEVKALAKGIAGLAERTVGQLESVPVAGWDDAMIGEFWASPKSKPRKSRE